MSLLLLKSRGVKFSLYISGVMKTSEGLYIRISGANKAVVSAKIYVSGVVKEII